jgi:uncharacterized alkaline shock family protein YloU
MVKLQEPVQRDLGEIGVSNEVFETISSVCAKKVAGVASMEASEGLVDSLTKVWGRGESSRGVKVTPGEEDLTVDLTVVLDEGYSIPQVAESVQREVKNVIEEMTGHTVRTVNLLVADVKPATIGSV